MVSVVLRETTPDHLQMTTQVADPSMKMRDHQMVILKSPLVNRIQIAWETMPAQRILWTACASHLNPMKTASVWLHATTMATVSLASYVKSTVFADPMGKTEGLQVTKGLQATKDLQMMMVLLRMPLQGTTHHPVTKMKTRMPILTLTLMQTMTLMTVE